MKPSEILRKLADMIDGQQAGDLGAPGGVDPRVMPKDTYNHPEQTDVEIDTGLAQAPDDMFLPPLQMKLELLKKATGVDNVYDEEEAAEEKSHSYDELDAIKRNAGINVVAIDALGDDEPLEG
jgi:hypothetical protein